MSKGAILKNLPIPQKSRRKFTYNYEESAGTSYLFSCCLVDNVFLHFGGGAEYIEKAGIDT
jgi:hypothetical protein